MLKSYEAIYNQGKLKWLKDVPSITDGKPVVVMIDTPSSHNPAAPDIIQKRLNEAKGAWGSGQSLDEIDLELNQSREIEWQRSWDH